MRSIFVAFLLSCLAFAQTAAKPQATPPPQAPAAPTVEKPATVPEADAVVINGFCPGKQAGPDCKTEIPKADIDRLAEAVGAPDAQKRGLANAYARAGREQAR